MEKEIKIKIIDSGIRWIIFLLFFLSISVSLGLSDIESAIDENTDVLKVIIEKCPKN